MTYEAIENSTDLGTPVELYEFTQGLRRWTFTSISVPVLYESQVYEPSPIKRDRVKQSTDIFRDNLKFTFPRDNSFANQYLGFAPEEVTTVTIRRGHLGDADGEYVVYWKGRVVGAKVSGNNITVEGESVFTSIRRPGLRAKYEYTCRHTLYGRACGVNQEAFKHLGNVNAINGVEIFVDGAGSFNDGYFTGGMLVSSNGSTRFITSHTSDKVIVSRPISDLVGNTEATLYPGCDHLRSTCINKFGNLPNFGGFPYIPKRNPFDGSSIV